MLHIQLTTQPAQQDNLSLFFIWGQAEPCATIAATSIPMLRVLFRRGDAAAATVAIQHRQRPHSDDYRHHHEHYNYQSYAYPHPGMASVNSGGDVEEGFRATAGGSSTRDSTATTTNTTAVKAGIHHHYHPWRLSYKAGVAASFVTASRGWSWMRHNRGFSNTDTIIGSSTAAHHHHHHHQHDGGDGESGNELTGITSATSTNTAAVTNTTTTTAASATDTCSTPRHSGEVCHEIISLEQFLTTGGVAVDGRKGGGGSSSSSSSIVNTATLDGDDNEEKDGADRCSSKASSRHDSFYQEHRLDRGRSTRTSISSGRDIPHGVVDTRSHMHSTASEPVDPAALTSSQRRSGCDRSRRDDTESSNISTRARHSEETCPYSTQEPLQQHDETSDRDQGSTVRNAEVQQPSTGSSGGINRSRNNTDTSDTATETYRLLLPDYVTAGRTEARG